MKKTINLVKAAKNPVKTKRPMDGVFVFLNLFVFFLLVVLLIVTLVLGAVKGTHVSEISALEDKITASENTVISQAEDKKLYATLKKSNEEIEAAVQNIAVSPKLKSVIFTAIALGMRDTIEGSGFAYDDGVISLNIEAEQGNEIMRYVDYLRGTQIFKSVGWGNSLIYNSSSDRYTCKLKMLVQSDVSAIV